MILTLFSRRASETLRTRFPNTRMSLSPIRTRGSPGTLHANAWTAGVTMTASVSLGSTTASGSGQSRKSRKPSGSRLSLYTGVT